jgi:hypothetical protein
MFVDKGLRDDSRPWWFKAFEERRKKVRCEVRDLQEKAPARDHAHGQ